jgi:glucosyl-dolichyl phosphate glucuronosyltransferase
MSKKVSILICTSNRAEELAKTLLAFERVAVPDGLSSEMVIVDNGSTDSTREVVRQYGGLKHIGMVRYAFEPRKGKGNAFNRGVSEIEGDFVLSTDDDVRPAEDWIAQFSSVLIEERADAAVGRIVAAPHLQRPWLTPHHALWLAVADSDTTAPPELIGANMAFRRAVLTRVPGYDPELGPGALGFGDDSLFSWQLEEAGFRIVRVPDALVVHHFDAARLRRRAWLETARQRGRTRAYLLHHWEHGQIPNPRLRRICLSTKLLLRRRLSPPRPLDVDGCDRWEMSYVGSIAMCQQYLVERALPRKYTRRGLIKRDVAGLREIPVGVDASNR